MKNKFTILVLSLLLFSIVPTFVSADIGPKPSADIHVTLNGQNVPDSSFNAKMLTCQKGEDEFLPEDLIPQLNVSEYDPTKDCYWRPAGLAWGGNCQDSNCNFNYMLPSQFRLAVYLPSQDKVYISAEITRENFRSAFEVDLISDGGITIQETTTSLQSSSVRNFFIALILTLILELLVALIYISKTKIPKKVLISVLVANVISLPIVWFVFPLLKIILLVILLGEVFAFVFEGYFIHLLNKKSISLKKSFVLSILMNLASLIIGGFIFLFLSVMFYP